MRFKNTLLALLFLLLCNSLLFAQEENDYYRETIFGLNLNTNGGLIGGAMVRHTREFSFGTYVNYGLEIVNVKHPNEDRVSIDYSGNSIIYGKKNYLIAFRPHVGAEFILFPKGKEDGVQVNVIVNGGPTIGILKPYYIQFSKNGVSPIEIVAYDEKLHAPENHFYEIIGSAGFFQGFDGTSVAPGIHLKSGLSFEFSTFGSNVSGIEAGTMIEAYTKKIELMQLSPNYSTYNRSIFYSLYLNIYFGGRR